MPSEHHGPLRSRWPADQRTRYRWRAGRALSGACSVHISKRRLAIDEIAVRFCWQPGHRHPVGRCPSWSARLLAATKAATLWLDMIIFSLGPLIGTVGDRTNPKVFEGKRPHEKAARGSPRVGVRPSVAAPPVAPSVAPTARAITSWEPEGSSGCPKVASEAGCWRPGPGLEPGLVRCCTTSGMLGSA